MAMSECEVADDKICYIDWVGRAEGEQRPSN
jgi:hypothetical protein